MYHVVRVDSKEVNVHCAFAHSEIRNASKGQLTEVNRLAYSIIDQATDKL